jgi:hypothetical protein
MIPFCREMNFNCAVAADYRPESEKIAIRNSICDFIGKQEPIVSDDRVNTCGLSNH